MIEAQFKRTMDADKYNADGLDKHFGESNENMKKCIVIIEENEVNWWNTYKFDFKTAFSLHPGTSSKISNDQI